MAKKTTDKNEVKYLTVWQCLKCKKHERTTTGRIVRYTQTKSMRCVVCQTNTVYHWIESVAENLGPCRNG